nr:recombinase [Paramuribaculum sp.]
MEIIDRYRGETRLLNMVEGYANYRHFYNNLCKGLNAIKEQLGLKYLTTYWARHTWSSIAYNELGISKDVISQALGHGNGNSVTDIYIDFSLKLIDDANRKVLDYVLYGKHQ